MTVQGRVVVWAALGILSLSFVACGGATPEARSARRRARAPVANPFPSRESLTKLAAAPVAKAPAQSVASAPEWNVVIDTSDASSPAEARFAQVATKSAAKLTYSKELRCVAREIGRFQVEHGAPPNERLKRFMIAACGMTNPAVGAMIQVGDATPDVPDEQILAEWQKTVAVPPAVKGNAVGVWMARNKKRVAILVAYAQPEAQMVVSPVDEAGAFTVRGEAPPNTEYVIGLVNQGTGVTTCEPDGATPLPLFALRCTMAKDDKTAWVEVAARAQGRLLLRSTGLGLARRDATAPISFVASARAPRPVTSPADLQKAILEGVNQVRSGAKLSPVELAPAQTSTNERLAPHFFAASLKNDLPKGDLVALGLIAGWDVDGTIKRGNLFSALLSGTTDANDWLGYALEMPMGRFTMLGAEARQMAIGVSTPSEVGGLGAVVTTYDMFTSNDHRADAALVFRQIEKARMARGLPLPTRIEGVPAVAQLARLVNEGKRDAEDALDEAMIAVRDHSHKSVRGWVLTTNQLEALSLPPELLGAGPLDLTIEVTHHKEAGAAWGSYVLFMVTPSAGPASTPTPQIQASRFRAAEARGSF
jgi:hypothetical protein